jgi:hypothetical protein
MAEDSLHFFCILAICVGFIGKKKTNYLLYMKTAKVTCSVLSANQQMPYLLYFYF